MINAGDPVDAKCYLSASGDLTIEGLIEGEIKVENVLTVGPNAHVAAQIFARVATIGGSVRGNVTAAEKVILLETATLDGDIVTPRIAIADGAAFNGSVSKLPLTMPSSNGNGRSVPIIHSEPTPTHVSNALAADPRDEMRPTYIPNALAADPRDEMRRESNREYDGRTSQSVGPQVDERRETSYRHVPPPASSHPSATRAEAPSGSVGPYWRRDDVEVPQMSRTLFGRELMK